MKKILFFIAVAFSVMSCLDGGSFSQSYTADVTFEFSDDVYKKEFKDSIYVIPAADYQDNGNGGGFIYLQYPLVFAEKQANGMFQGGFLMSILKGEKDGLLTRPELENDKYRVHAVGGAPQAGVAINSKAYAVFYDNPDESMMPEYDIEFGYKDVGSCLPVGCYVNNTTLVARKVRENFTDGDKLVLTVTGYKGDGSKTEEKSITLAEYTEAKDSVMYNWTPLDLSKLGDVDYVKFDVKSTNPDVPGYFCIDGYLANIKVEY